MSEEIDWTRGIRQTFLVVKDKDGNPVTDGDGFGGKWDGSPNFSLFYPMTIRITLVVVAKGATYNPHCVTWRLGEMHFRDLVRLKNVAASWERGQLGAALAAAEKELESSDPARAEEARRAVEALKAHAEKQRKELVELRSTLPEYPPVALAQLGRKYAPSQTGKDLMAEAEKWGKDPALANARKARVIFDTAREAFKKVAGKGTTKDPEFARRFSGELHLIAQVAAKLKKDYPETPACKQALDLVAGLGIHLPE